LLKMAIKVPLRFIIITPMYTSHAHLLQDRNPLTSVEGSCFPSQLVFLSLVRAFVASSSHQCHELHTPVRMPDAGANTTFSLCFLPSIHVHSQMTIATDTLLLERMPPLKYQVEPTFFCFLKTHCFCRTMQLPETLNVLDLVRKKCNQPGGCRQVTACNSAAITFAPWKECCCPLL
jgi:hypothetical protein